MIIHISSSAERKEKTVVVALGTISFIEFEYEKDSEGKSTDEVCLHFNNDTADKTFTSDEKTSITFEIFKCDDFQNTTKDDKGNEVVTPSYSCNNVSDFENLYLQATAEYLEEKNLEQPIVV